MDQSQRTVHADDAITWLKSQSVLEGHSFVASLPDFSEFPSMSLEEWKSWFTETAKLVMSKTPDLGVSIFFQSDIKVDGIWVDKSYLIQKAAEEMGVSLLWHKVFCRHGVDRVTFGRPSYSHLLCFSKSVRADVAKSTADVVSDMGDQVWARGMGLKACEVACDFILKETSTRSVINPFCGWGSVLAMANIKGLKAIGIEKSAKRAEKARKLQVSKLGQSWDAQDQIVSN